ncbi:MULTISPECIES: BolA family protein [Asaia]|uniref:Cell division protein BolA n=1 Tax=Asaia bogorensis TaxID=91915 RepID=A0A060QF81_9PROT|nr:MULTISPECIES: BolA family protein [Asaia]ETC99916.1 BolA family transcriptional regulator [Asaia sp. SF2.1]MDL2172203.1 BolA family transcriptional regulator [Asaia sp. HumB]MDR6181760.1 stress-induced morphogen [Asaia bogorensis NBRC 16594]NIE79792.1 BolA family transcriptional regulator [Asaia sp. As-1742]CDG39343.1 Cell division protein BolA [Asaia bogorensis]
MTELKERAARMSRQLQDALAPAELTIRDDSKRHAHHAGRNGVEGDETHFTMTIVSPRFAGMNRVARHRLINEMLKPEFESGLHALSLKLHAPEEV